MKIKSFVCLLTVLFVFSTLQKVAHATACAVTTEAELTAALTNTGCKEIKITAMIPIATAGKIELKRSNTTLEGDTTKGVVNGIKNAVLIITGNDNIIKGLFMDNVDNPTQYGEFTGIFNAGKNNTISANVIAVSMSSDFGVAYSAEAQGDIISGNNTAQVETKTINLKLAQFLCTNNIVIKNANSPGYSSCFGNCSGIDPSTKKCVNNILKPCTNLDIDKNNIDDYMDYWTFIPAKSGLTPTTALCGDWAKYIIAQGIAGANCKDSGGTFVASSNTCTCPSGKHLSKEFKCITCNNAGEIYDSVNKECGCNAKLLYGKLVDKCVVCSQKEGMFLDTTGVCLCNESGFKYDPSKDKCVPPSDYKCNADSEIVDPTTGNCLCREGFAKYQDGTPCVQCGDGKGGYGRVDVNGKCICNSNSGFYKNLRGECSAKACTDADGGDPNAKPNSATGSCECNLDQCYVYAWPTGDPKPHCEQIPDCTPKLDCSLDANKSAAECQIPETESSGGCSLIRR